MDKKTVRHRVPVVNVQTRGVAPMEMTSFVIGAPSLMVGHVHMLLLPFQASLDKTMPDPAD
jgi:hypothetical protein